MPQESRNEAPDNPAISRQAIASGFLLQNVELETIACRLMGDWVALKNRMFSPWRIAVAILLLTISSVSIPGNASGDDPVVDGYLRLISGDFAKGRLVGSSMPNHLDWQCEPFDSPLQVEILHLQRLETGMALSPIENQEAFQFSLKGNDSLFGSWVSADDTSITVRHAILGDVEIPITQLSQARRIESPQDIVFHGWESDAALIDSMRTTGSEWELNGRSLVASKASARLTSHARLPAQYRMDLRMAWEGKPQFALALGVDATDANICCGTAYRSVGRGAGAGAANQRESRRDLPSNARSE